MSNIESFDLEKISKKINLIENRDDNYTDNETWKKLKDQQDYAYFLLANKKLEDLIVRNKKFRTEDNEKKIMILQDYINKYGKKYLNNTEVSMYDEINQE